MAKRLEAFQQLCDIVYEKKGYTSRRRAETRNREKVLDFWISRQRGCLRNTANNIVDKELYITIEFFGMHGVIADTDRVQMPVTATTTVSDVIEYITAKYPGITIDKESVVTAVNHEIVPLTKALRANDIVSLFPHIGGG